MIISLNRIKNFILLFEVKFFLTLTIIDKNLLLN